MVEAMTLRRVLLDMNIEPEVLLDGPLGRVQAVTGVLVNAYWVDGAVEIEMFIPNSQD